MKKILLLLFLIAFSPLLSQNPDNSTDYTKFINVFIGTGSVDSLSLSGSNFPGACYPFGLVQLSPDTDDNPEDPCSGYDYADSTIVGFSHTHLNGTGVADLFDFLFMPYGGKIKWDTGSDDRKVKGYRSGFRHENETGYPGYYSVILDDYNIKAELTATEHCGMHRYTFSSDAPHHLIIDLDHSLDKKRPYWRCRIIGAQAMVIDNRTIEGYRIITGWARLRKVYFRAEFSRPFTSHAIKAGTRIYKNVKIANGTNLKIVLTFGNNSKEPLTVKVGLSSVNYNGARENLKKEIKGFDFDRVVKNTNSQWNRELSSIDLEATESQKRIFYTGLYHLFIQPNNIADANGNYLDSNLELKRAPDGKSYSTFSLWDTYRAAHPLYTIIKPKKAAEFINSMLRQYVDYGYLPIWQLWNSETYCMIGNHAIPVIVDAYFKNLRGIDFSLAWEAVKASSTTPHRNSPFHILDKYGYFPENLQSQSVSLGLEIAYDDWCAAQMAKALGHTEEYEYFNKRSGFYKNLFDKKIGFFRAKNDKAQWIEPFSPLVYGGNGGYPFTEGNGWQYLWYVPHQVKTFIRLLGGKNSFNKKLDTFFTLKAKPEDVNGNASGFIGQYAHGNEPSHHIAYFYDYSGKPWKTQYLCAKIMNEQFTDTPSGYSGNEDCGQMSAWYILSAMGFYPFNPANGIYAIGSPQLKKAVINLENGNKFTVITHNAGGKNCYIQKAKLNGKKYNKSYITHNDIVSGGTIEFYMGNKPNKKWGKTAPPATAWQY